MAFRTSFATERVNLLKVPAFRAENFPYSGPYPWLDRPDAAERIDAKLKAGEMTAAAAELCRAWMANGYVVLPGLVSSEVLDAVWSAYESAIASGRIQLAAEPAGAGDPYPGRFLNPHKKSSAFCRILKHGGLLQTIASHKGSQQGLHSDSIHMTTYPLGYLTAAWIAFEDIHPDSGPLVYYPGSHRLPYVFSKDVGLTEAEYKERGYAPYHEKYEPRIREMIAESGIEPHYLHARKGDVLIWHANLVHGGSPRRNLQLSRKAVVVHFFVKGAFVYHDLVSSPSKNQYLGTCLLRDGNGRIGMAPRVR